MLGVRSGTQDSEALPKNSNFQHLTFILSLRGGKADEAISSALLTKRLNASLAMTILGCHILRRGLKERVNSTALISIYT